MEMLTHADLRRLAETSEPYCVSIYMPTHRTGVETRQDPLRLKGLLDNVEERLKAGEIRSTEVRAILEPARRLLDRSTFWAHQADGLALFLRSEGMETFRLPRRFAELSVVDNQFYVTPLFQVINEDTTFFILAISPKRVRLLRASRDVVKPVEVEGLPKNFDELGKYIDTERLLQFHTRAAPAGRRPRGRAAVFHGQGVGTDDAQWKKQLLDFCHMVARKLRPTLNEGRSPLVLAADQSLVPIYREANSYAHTMDDAVLGNPDDASEKQLRDAAWPIVREQQEKARSRVLEEFGDAMAKNQASALVEQVVPAAFDGRIATLLVGEGCQRWGQFDTTTRQIVVRDERQAGDEELINRAAIEAYRKGGEVYGYELDKMPDRSPLAAVYRY